MTQTVESLYAVSEDTAKRQRVLRALLIVFFALMAGKPLFSQTNAGRILGTVEDITSLRVKDTKITVTDVQRGLKRLVTTDEAGDFVVPDLPPGLYTLRAEAKGLKAVEHPNIELQVGMDARIDFRLQPGDSSEVITVTSQVPMIGTTNDILGGTLPNKTINDLPLNGRDFQNLVVLRPGVMRYPGGGEGSVSANGIRPEDNNYLIDGFDNNDPYFGQSVVNGSGVQGTPATILPIDAIQEFNVEQNSPAQYGWKPGAVINVGLKSGTNVVLGTTYYFGRNDILDARNLFDVAPVAKKPLRVGQFGGTLGGPIVQDKIFFFLGYEGVRDLVGVAQEIPSPATVSLAGRNPVSPNCTFSRSGDCANSIPDALADLKAGGIGESALSLRLASLFPDNAGLNPAGTGIITTGFPNTNRSDNGLAKIDYHINDRNILNGTYFVGDSLQNEQDQPVLQPQWESQAHTNAQLFGMGWMRIASAAWVNEARIGINRLSQFNRTADGNVNPTTYGISTGVTNPFDFGMPQISVAGFLPLGGNSGWPQRLAPAQTLQFTDNVSYSFGQQALKFGGEVRRNSVNQQKDRLGKSRIRFGFGDSSVFPGATSLEDFLAGEPSDGRVFLGNSLRHVSFWSYAGFMQDDWHASQKLTVNLGLRYELNTVIKEANNLLGNFDPALGLVQVGKQTSSAYNGAHTNFAPRLGIAWDPFGTAKTVFRAGCGVAYEIPTLSTFLGQFNMNNDPGTIGINIVPTGALGVTPAGGTINTGIQSAPASSLNWTSAGPIFGRSALSCTPTAPCDVFAVDRNLHTPFVASWNVNLQHAFSDNLSLQAGYVANRGAALYGVKDLNQIENKFAAEIACGHCENNADRPYGAKFPYLGFINWLSNADRSNYDSLQVTVTQRSARGISFLVGYTYSHALDNASDNRAPQVMDSTRPWLDYGNSDFDIRHRLTASFTYDIPSRESRGRLLAGWQVNSIMTWQGGQPWNVVDTGDDISGTAEGSDRWNFFGNPTDFKPSASGGIPWYPSGTSSQNGLPAAIDVPACVEHADLSQLRAFGCYMKGNSVMTPPDAGTFGSMGRNIFRGTGLVVFDFSLVKAWSLTPAFRLQFRGEFFNVLNHPALANPYGANGTFFQVDPSSPHTFGCACSTPDVAEANPVLGTGGPRNIQFGLKLIF